MLELNDELFPLTQAGRHWPLREPPSVCTVIRWATKGVGKERVRLETIKVGGRRYTSRAALARFVARLTGGVDASADRSHERSQTYQDAEDECLRAGL